MDKHLLIVGASARAAAFSALRAGLRPWCADLFADRDLVARCPAVSVPSHRYPEGFPELLTEAPPGPWMYTGALENHLSLVERLARVRPLWGNDRSALTVVRSPAWVSTILSRAGLLYPAVRPATDPPPVELDRWLLKPLAGSAGIGIHPWSGTSLSSPLAAKSYFQEFVEGQSCSALFVTRGEQTLLLGVTRQLVGEAWLGAGPFRYCGSVGPLPVSGAVRFGLERVGRVLAEAAGLRGLFGIDFILRAGVPWPVEVNPRYTASVEVLEYATDLSALAMHRRAFCPGETSGDGCGEDQASIVGKAILFARESILFPAEGPWEQALSCLRAVEERPDFADIPLPGQGIERGRPVLTFFAQANTEGDCIEALRRIAADLDRWLYRG
jgi:uncharacterized protein